MRYTVRPPITGYVSVEVDDESIQSEEDAIDAAFESRLTYQDIVEWEVIRSVGQGNVCYCMQPWDAEAILEDDGEEQGES